MKTIPTIAIVITAVGITAAIQEARISALRKDIAAQQEAARVTAAANPAAVGQPQDAAKIASPAAAGGRRRIDLPGSAPRQETAPDAAGELSASVRKMWDNPAGKAIMNQGLRMAVSMQYQDFIESMNLSKEESEYFRNLVSRQMGGEMDLGIKIAGAGPEESQRLLEEHEKAIAESDENVRKFLNNDDDYQEYRRYKERLPEREQIGGIRALMGEKGVPMDEQTEKHVIEAMFNARNASGANAENGGKAGNAAGAGSMTEAFEGKWARQQEVLNRELSGVLNEEQMKAFTDYRNQMKDLQLMGVKAAERAMKKAKK